MTPMIDVVFLLLAFFIITAKFRRPEAFLPIRLPSPDSTQTAGIRIVEPLVLVVSASSEGCLVRIGAESEIRISEEEPERGLAALADSLGRVCRQQQRTAADPFEMVCENEVTWNLAVKVYDILHAMGATDITLVTTEYNYEPPH